MKIFKEGKKIFKTFFENTLKLCLLASKHGLWGGKNRFLCHHETVKCHSETTKCHSEPAKCHPELVSGSRQAGTTIKCHPELVSGSSQGEIPKQVRDDRLNNRDDRGSVRDDRSIKDDRGNLQNVTTNLQNVTLNSFQGLDNKIPKQVRDDRLNNRDDNKIPKQVRDDRNIKDDRGSVRDDRKTGHNSREKGNVLYSTSSASPTSKKPFEFGVFLALALIVAMGLNSYKMAQAVNYSVDQNKLSEGQSSYSNINLTSDNKIKLQDGIVGTWSGDDQTGTYPVLRNNADSDGVWGADNCLYIIEGSYNTSYFLKFDPLTKNWSFVNNLPAKGGAGSSLTTDTSGNIYFLPGDNLSDFYKYSISADNWTKLADLPINAGSGSKMVYVNSGTGFVYAFRGNNSNTFWKYDVAGNIWTQKTAFPGANIFSWGIEAVYDGADSIYAASSYYGNFYKYSIGTDTWGTALSSPGGYPYRHRFIMKNATTILNVRNNVYSYRTEMKSYDTTTNKWSDLASPPTGFGVQSNAIAVAYDGSDNIYSTLGWFQGSNLYRYTISTNSWNTEFTLDALNGSTGTNDTYSHKKLIFDGDHTVYYMAGPGYGWDSSRQGFRLIKLDLATNTSTQLATYPVTGQTGWSGIFKENYLYMMPPYGSRYFYKYDLSNNSWEQKADIPATIDYGSELIDGGDDYLYATRGGSTKTFYRYTISTDIWEELATTPYSMYVGGGLTKMGNYIYGLPGSPQSNIIRYDIVAGTWSDLGSINTGSISHGGTITSDASRYLYITPSDRSASTGSWLIRYDTTNGAQMRLADIPTLANVLAYSFYDTNTNRLYFAPSSASNLLYYWTPGTTNYVTSGTWISQTYDLTQVSSWNGINYTLGGSGTTVVDTRTSSDGKIWQAWRPVSGGNIQSSPNRFLQIRVTLTGDGNASPEVSNINFDYTQETQAPSQPSQFTAKSLRGDGAVDIMSGQPYEYQHPHFSWSGASDGPNGSGVDGYYVYFGTDSSADPATMGTYQTATDFVVSSSMTSESVYYLIIKVKDKLGNVSGAATWFSYRYQYISPPAVVEKTTRDDYTSGTNTNIDVSVSDGDMKLRKQDTGYWSVGDMKTMPDTSSGGASIVVGGDLYLLRGSSTQTFWKYNFDAQSWTTISNVPGTISNGSSLTYDGVNYLYATRGGGTNNLYRYDIQNDLWITLPSMPNAMNTGGAIQFIGNNKILILFSGTSDFYYYDISNSSYLTLAALPAIVDSGYGGSGVWFDGADTVYAYLGSYTYYDTGRRMYRYSISNDAWTPLSDPPNRYSYMQNNLANDGNGNLYIFGQDTLFNNYTRAQKYNIATGVWSKVDTYLNGTRGNICSDNQRFIYIINSQGRSRRIVKFDTWENKSVPIGFQPEQKSMVPFEISTTPTGWMWSSGLAGTMDYDGSKYVYVLGGTDGGTWSTFQRFNYQDGKSEYLPSPPYAGRSGTLKYSNGYIYYLASGGTSYFYRFSTQNKKWEKMANTLATITNPGSNTMIVDKNGNLFVPRGSSSKTFYKYTPDAGIGAWSTMTATSTNVSEGSAIYDGDNTIYLIFGGGSSGYAKYNITANSWSPLTSLPAAANYGTSMVIDNGKIYTIAGNYREQMQIYDITSNAWTTGATLPETPYIGTNMVKINSEMALAFFGGSSASLWQFNFPATNRAYDGLGIHISQPIQTDGIFDYAGISADVNIPANTDVEFYTRTSADSNTWSAWQYASEIKKDATKLNLKVASPPKKYLQIKLIMTSDDNLYSPTVSNYAVSYYFDLDPPTNPTTLEVFSDSSQTTPLANNTWYNHSRAYFKWPAPGQAGGGFDGEVGSRIKGYFVYLGPDESAIPSTAGQFVTTEFFEANLNVSQNYYFRLQSQDVTGNVSEATFSPFLYKYDQDPPSNPPFISVNPSGYTATNKYTLSWPTASDTHSQVAEYCYKTGATTGIYSQEQCQTGRELVDVPISYRQGTNVFYLRTRDNANNYSTSYLEASYYYSTDPPTPVVNLRAIPPVSTANMFAFLWDLPTYFAGDQNRLTYCYSINELPSNINTTCVNDTYIAPFKAATQTGTNIIYVVAKDESNNINWNNYASGNFIANTVSPGIPINLVVTDTSDQASNRWSLTVTWSRPTFEGNGISFYSIERSVDGHTFVPVGTVSNTAFVDMDVTSETKYFYRVRASDSINNYGGYSSIVSQTARGKYITPPGIITTPTLRTSFDSAEISWVTARESTSFVYYGSSPSSLDQSKGTLDLSSTHSITISGLSSQTVYYFRVQSFDLERNYSLEDTYSQVYSLRTTETAVVSQVKSSDETVQSIVLSWQSNVPTRATLEYGVSDGYGLLQEEASGFTTSHMMKLEGLQGGTTYHFRIKATTEYGSEVKSDDYQFTTVAYPVISNIKFQPFDAPTVSVKVSWNTNVPTDSVLSFRFGSVSQERATSGLVTAHEIILDSLAGSAEYSMIISGRDKYGNQCTSDLQRWTSQVDTRQPEISGVYVDTSVVGVGTDSRAQVIISWDTDEPSTSSVKYSQGATNQGSFDKETPLDTTLTTSHVVVISNLQLSQIYRIQPYSKDSAGNTTFGEETITITPRKESSILELIISSFEGMLSRINF